MNFKKKKTTSTKRKRKRKVVAEATELHIGGHPPLQKETDKNEEQIQEVEELRKFGEVHIIAKLQRKDGTPSVFLQMYRRSQHAELQLQMINRIRF